MITAINHSIAVAVFSFFSKSMLMEYIAIIFSDGTLVIAFALYVFVMLPLRRKGMYSRTVFHDILPALSAMLVVLLLKYLFPSDRPYAALHLVPFVPATDPHASFPSMHSALIAAFATTLLSTHPRLGKVIAFMVPFTMLGRVAVGVHWASDVLIGASIGIVVALCYGPLEKKWSMKKPG